MGDTYLFELVLRMRVEEVFNDIFIFSGVDRAG